MSEKQGRPKSQSDKYSWKWVDGTPITRQNIADLLNISLRQVDNIVNSEGCPLDDFSAFLEWYHTKDFIIYDEEGAGYSLNQLKQMKMAYDTRKAKHEANRAEIAEKRERHSLDVDESVYVEKEIVESRIMDISKRFGERLFALPSRVVKALMGATSEQEMKEILDSELRKLTEEVDSWKVF
ncbi:hypothetical protein F4212_01290 [Candidatus Poribacteria bacterium]|nr:hypothetical protein [Candidatus Poribacteria bacterium]